MRARVFSQSPGTAVDVGQVAAHARRYVRAELHALGHRLLEEGAGEELTLEVVVAGEVTPARASLRSRPRTRDDLDAALAAEVRGQAAGMGQLARRCPTVLELEADDELVGYTLAAALASVALGPILPDDGATLFGVRGALERAERVRAARRKGGEPGPARD